MRPLRYSINVTLDGCCDHRAMLADEDLHRHAVENLDSFAVRHATYESVKSHNHFASDRNRGGSIG